MKDQFLKIAKVKTEEEFYKKFPTEKSFIAKHGADLKKAGFGDIVKGLGGASGIADTAGSLVGGIQNLSSEIKQRKSAEQWEDVSDVVLRATQTKPEQQKRKYIRPEEYINTGEEFFPVYGVGTNVLKHGGEIQNTNAPGTLYDDLGFEPLNDSTKVKAFYNGGKMTIAESGWMTDFANQGGGDTLSQIMTSIIGKNAGGDIGGTIGGTAGSLIGGPVGEMIGKVGGKSIGSLLDTNPARIKKANKAIQTNMGKVGLMNSAQTFQDNNSGFMEEGGWVSHNWNPQVITKFGEHKLSELLKPDPMMDTLRSGGHLKEDYSDPSQRSLSLGGDLQTYWGGYAEPISENKFLPDNGETVMFRGQSHDDSDGKGRSGIGITFGNTPVEVEHGEPAVKLNNGGTDNDLVVFGNLPITRGFADMLNDSDAKGKKFKTYVADLSKKESKANSLIDKSSEELSSMEINTPFDKLKMSGLTANITGSNMKLKQIAEKKENAAMLQSAINDTADELGLVPEELAKGKIKQAKTGIKIAEGGITADSALYDNLTKLYEEASKAGKGPKVTEFQQAYYKAFPEEAEKIIRNSPVSTLGKSKGVTAAILADPNTTRETLFAINDDIFGPRTKQFYASLRKGQEQPVSTITPMNVPDIQYYEDPSLSPLNDPISLNYEAVDPKRAKFNWMQAINGVVPYLRPSDAESLDPRQLAGEMYALATNQIEPIQAQTIQPELGVPYNISYQDLMNENQSDFRAMERLVGNNPAALAKLSSEKYKANQRVMGEQFRANQAEKARVYEKNRDLITNTRLQNQNILDKQYERQEMAKANTKATTFSALSSISDKFLKNKLENRTLKTYENLYNYRYDNNGRLINMNSPAVFNLPTDVGQSVDQTDTKTAKKRNGSIVSAMKNL